MVTLFYPETLEIVLGVGPSSKPAIEATFDTFHYLQRLLCTVHTLITPSITVM
jgi:hypothetical protein